MLGRLLSKVRKSVERRGVFGTVRHAFGRFAHPLLELTPARRRQRRQRERADRAFDERYGVDTGGFIQLNRLRIPGTSWEYGVPYWGIDPEVFAHMLGSLAIDHAAFTFVDFGSGKGRAVLLASEFPFRKIVGIEFSADLNDVARRNVHAFRSHRRQCRDIELLCIDALQYALPEGPVVCYFYNPFDREVMERVVDRVVQSCRENPREVYVLYANPLLGARWERPGCFRTRAANGDFVIYKAEP